MTKGEMKALIVNILSIVEDVMGNQLAQMMSDGDAEKAWLRLRTMVDFANGVLKSMDDTEPEMRSVVTKDSTNQVKVKKPEVGKTISENERKLLCDMNSEMVDLVDEIDKKIDALNYIDEWDDNANDIENALMEATMKIDDACVHVCNRLGRKVKENKDDE